MALTSATRGARPIGWLVAVMLGSGVLFVGLRLVTPGDRLAYQVLPGPRTAAVPVTLRRAGVADRLLQAWGTMGWVGAAAFVVLFPRPWPPLMRDRRLPPVIYATPVGLLAACSLVALAGASRTQWIGRVIAAGTFIALAVLGMGIVLGIVRYRHTTDPIGRQQLEWLAGGGVVSASLALTLWLLPELVLGRDLLPAQWVPSPTGS